MTRHEIQVLREAAVPGARVARQAEVSERSVWRIAKEAPVGDDTAQSASMKRAVGRPSTAAPWATVITGWLDEERHLPGLEILRRVQEQGYAGGKSAVYELIHGCARSRPSRWSASKACRGSSANTTSAKSTSATRGVAANAFASSRAG